MFWDVIIPYIISLEHIFDLAKVAKLFFVLSRCHEDVVTFLTWEWKLTTYHVCLRCWKMKCLILSSWNIETFWLICLQIITSIYFIRYQLISRPIGRICYDFSIDVLYLDYHIQLLTFALSYDIWAYQNHPINHCLPNQAACCDKYWYIFFVFACKI